MRKSGQYSLGRLRSFYARLRGGFEPRSAATERGGRTAHGAAKEIPAQGPSTPDLRPPPSNQTDPSNLLRRRMKTLHLDLAQLARCDSATASELQRLCMMCERRIACAIELEHPSADAAWAEWREYCPNASKLNELRIRQAMQSSVSEIPSGRSKP
jgi:hypothetical protein